MAGRQQTFTEQVRLAGNALCWDDWQFPCILVNLPAIADPRFAKWLDDGAGSVGVYEWFFDQGEVAPFVPQQLTHRYLEGTDLLPHVHFIWVSTPAPGKKVSFSADIHIVGINGTGAATTTLCTGTYTATAADVARRHVILPLTPNISGAGVTISSVGNVTLKRHPNGADDDLAAEVIVRGLDLHHQIDGSGSDAHSSKTA